ncbi:50S ribosomal protein L29 [candidate division KSB1 bacterium]
MKMNEIKEMPKEELEAALEDKIVELENLEFQLSIHQIDNPMLIRQTRRDIARIKTVLREFELGLRKSKEVKS